MDTVHGGRTSRDAMRACVLQAQHGGVCCLAPPVSSLVAPVSPGKMDDAEDAKVQFFGCNKMKGVCG